MTPHTVHAKEATAMQSSENRSAPPSSMQEIYQLRLYVAGQTPKSVLALKNLKQICEE